MDKEKQNILAVIGLGNPGKKFINTRHNIGFRVVELLCDRFYGSWQEKNNMELATVALDGKKILLIKPQTFMNDSGKIIPFLQKQGIKAENILVVHDELEKKFGTLQIRLGGSHRGHNGLRSIIDHCGKEFYRLRFGIGRPEKKEDVGNFVLQNFTESNDDIQQLLEQSADEIERILL